MQNLAPIALFVYNRPEHTRRTIKFLQENLLADESRLYIFSDGPHASADRSLVDEVREITQNVSGFKSVEVIRQGTNLGLAASVINGVTQLTHTYGKVIAFEDDLITSPYTLQYFNDALTHFEEEPKVMHIGAYMYPLKDQNLPQTFFYRAATSWGWATWQRAWNMFEPDIDQLISRFDDQLIDQFSIEGHMNFWRQMLEFKAGKNNSWAIRWYASVFLQGGLTLNPSRSLIQNIGHDGSGVHSGINTMYNVAIYPRPISQFPDQLQENQQAYAAIKEFLKTRKGSLWQRGFRFVRSKTKGWLRG